MWPPGRQGESKAKADSGEKGEKTPLSCRNRPPKRRFKTGKKKRAPAVKMDLFRLWEKKRGGGVGGGKGKVWEEEGKQQKVASWHGNANALRNDKSKKSRGRKL